MTPKDKASALMLTFMGITLDFKERTTAKECAMQCVDEILENIKYIASTEAIEGQATQYWEAVKEELGELK